MNRLAIIVLNWNGSDDAIECVDSLIKQTLKPTIIIVDNNSSDNSVTVFEEYISSHKKEKIILLKNSDNLGFAGGINTGLIYALKTTLNILEYLIRMRSLIKTGANLSFINYQNTQNAELLLEFYKDAIARLLTQLEIFTQRGDFLDQETVMSP